MSQVCLANDSQHDFSQEQRHVRLMLCMDSIRQMEKLPFPFQERRLHIRYPLHAPLEIITGYHQSPQGPVYMAYGVDISLSGMSFQHSELITEKDLQINFHSDSTQFYDPGPLFLRLHWCNKKHGGHYFSGGSFVTI